MQTFVGKWEVAMRERGSVIAFCAVIASIGTTVFASSSARAMRLAGLNSAIRQAIPTQEARYKCRRHSCYYASRPERSHFNGNSHNHFNGYYYGWNWGGMYPGETEYNYHYWGSPLNSGK